jgi:hypothetical protein
MERYNPDRYEPKGHHVLNYRAQWDAMPATKMLRAQPGLLVPGWRRPHDELHRAVEYVPPLSMYIAQSALNGYIDYPEDHLRSMDSFMLATEQATKHRRATPMEVAVANLAIQAVDLQKPFVRAIIAPRSRRTIA